jgi:hypothetical protein
VGQVSDAGEMKNAYKVLVGNLEDIRPLWKRRRRRANNIKIDFLIRAFEDVA